MKLLGWSSVAILTLGAVATGCADPADNAPPAGESQEVVSGSTPFDIVSYSVALDLRAELPSPAPKRHDDCLASLVLATEDGETVYTSSLTGPNAGAFEGTFEAYRYQRFASADVYMSCAYVEPRFDVRKLLTLDPSDAAVSASKASVELHHDGPKTIRVSLATKESRPDTKISEGNCRGATANTTRFFVRSRTTLPFDINDAPHGDDYRVALKLDGDYTKEYDAVPGKMRDVRFTYCRAKSMGTSAIDAKLVLSEDDLLSDDVFKSSREGAFAVGESHEVRHTYANRDYRSVLTIVR